MALNKRNYVAGSTTITATNLNDIQDAISTLESTASAAGQTFQTIANKTTSISASSTDTQYPSAKAVWDMGDMIYQEAQRYTDSAISSALDNMDATGVKY